jgi:hypothetical protein
MLFLRSRTEENEVKYPMYKVSARIQLLVCSKNIIITKFSNLSLLIRYLRCHFKKDKSLTTLRMLKGGKHAGRCCDKIVFISRYNQ